MEGSGISLTERSLLAPPREKILLIVRPLIVACNAAEGQTHVKGARRGVISQRKSPLACIANPLASQGGKSQGCHDHSPAFIALNKRHDRRTGIVARRPIVGRQTGQNHQKPDCHGTLPELQSQRRPTCPD